MGIPLHITHDRRRLSRSTEGNFDLLVDRRSLLGSMDENGSAEDVARTRASRLAFDAQLPVSKTGDAPLTAPPLSPVPERAPAAKV